MSNKSTILSRSSDPDGRPSSRKILQVLQAGGGAGYVIPVAWKRKELEAAQHQQVKLLLVVLCLLTKRPLGHRQAEGLSWTAAKMGR